MSRRKPRYVPEPRVWSRYQAACRLGLHEETFNRRLPKLLKEGFPPWDDFLGGFDAEAIELWFDRRAGLVKDSPEQDVRGMIAEWGASR